MLDSSRDSWRTTRAMWDAFSFHGKVDVDVRLQIAPYVGGMSQQQSIFRASRRQVWSEAFIEDLSRRCAGNELAGEFGQMHTERALEALREMGASVQGKHVVVLSSGEPPWIEACVLALRAETVTRIGAGLVTSLHPKVTVYTLEQAEAAVAAGRMPAFDSAASYLTLHHEGLGRHGEFLSPLADLQLMARVWCIMKPSAPMLLTVPVGNDYIHWKYHRVYGSVMLPHLVANWHVRVFEPEKKTLRAITPPILLLDRLDDKSANSLQTDITLPRRDSG